MGSSVVVSGLRGSENALAVLVARRLRHAGLVVVDADAGNDNANLKASDNAGGDINPGIFKGGIEIVEQLLALCIACSRAIEPDAAHGAGLLDQQERFIHGITFL